MTIYLATAEGDSEVGGVYHGNAVRAANPNARVISLVSDKTAVDKLTEEQRQLVMRPEDVSPKPGDVLVVTSAEPFPVHCADVLADRMPMVASSMAYLVQAEAEGAQRLDLKNRAAAVTVQTEAEWESFSTAVGLPADHPHEVVGNPQVDTVPQWEPAHPRRVAVLTGVTPDYVGQKGRTPDGDLALVAAKELQAAGADVVVCKHPRDPSGPYEAAGLRISDRKTIDEVAEAAAVVGIPGTVNTQIAAMSRRENGRTVGPPFVGVGDHSYLPKPLQEVYTPAPRGTSVLAALNTAQPLDHGRAAEITGPLRSGAGQLQLQAWEKVGTQAAERAALGRQVEHVLGPQRTTGASAGPAATVASRTGAVTPLNQKGPKPPEIG